MRAHYKETCQSYFACSVGEFWFQQKQQCFPHLLQMTCHIVETNSYAIDPEKSDYKEKVFRNIFLDQNAIKILVQSANFQSSDRNVERFCFYNRSRNHVLVGTVLLNIERKGYTGGFLKLQCILVIPYWDDKNQGMKMCRTMAALRLLANYHTRKLHRTECNGLCVALRSVWTYMYSTVSKRWNSFWQSATQKALKTACKTSQTRELNYLSVLIFFDNVTTLMSLISALLREPWSLLCAPWKLWCSFSSNIYFLLYVSLKRSQISSCYPDLLKKRKI